MTRNAWPVHLAAALLVAAAGVLSVLGFRPAGEPPDLVLRDSGGRRVELRDRHGGVWVASFVGRRCLDRCPEALEQLALLSDRLPSGAPLVTFVVGARGLWPPRPAVARDRGDWTFVQGNDVDADGEERVIEWATGSLGFGSDEVSALEAGDPAVLLATIDPDGGVRGRYRIAASPPERAPALAATLADVALVSTLRRDPLAQAGLNAATGVLLVVALALVARRVAALHLGLLAGAVLCVTVFLASWLVWAHRVGVPAWPEAASSRAVYFAVLAVHAALTALALPLAAALLVLAARRRFEAHAALALRGLPAWISVSFAGALIYLLLYTWFPGA